MERDAVFIAFETFADRASPEALARLRDVEHEIDNPIEETIQAPFSLA